MIIQNFQQLAISSLRKQALLIAEAGYQAVNTRAAVLQGFDYRRSSGRLRVGGREYDLNAYSKVYCVGFGKAAFEAVSTLHDILRDRITAGYVIDLKGGALGNIVSRVGTHPYPTIINVQATKELVALLEGATEEDLVICVVSGGGSALLCYPFEMSCEAETAVIAALTAKGATISELNTVRKHISLVKGGQLAKVLYPATCISLIFSDVPGDDLSMVASGPTVPDTTFMRDAAEILKRYTVLELCQLPTCRLVETPKDEKYFTKVQNVLFVSARTALAAMRQRAEELGFRTRIFSESFQGIARELGPVIVSSTAHGECLLGAGESTVHITGTGTGGRNQEMALAALGALSSGQVLVCLASDGRDNTDAAGAVADELTAKKAVIAGMQAGMYLENNDSFEFFRQLGDAVHTGITGSNVSDFFVCLRGRGSAGSMRRSAR